MSVKIYGELWYKHEMVKVHEDPGGGLYGIGCVQKCKVIMMGDVDSSITGNGCNHLEVSALTLLL